MLVALSSLSGVTEDVFAKNPLFLSGGRQAALARKAN